MRDIWSSLSENFDINLPRMSAISIKEDDYDLGFYCPSPDGRIGYHFLDTALTAYNNDRYTLEFYFATYEYPNLCAQPGKTRFLFSEQSYRPGQISHTFHFPNSALAGKESLSAAVPGGLRWSFELKNTSTPLPDPTHIYRYSKKLYSVFKSHDRFEAFCTKDNSICIDFKDRKYYITCNMSINFAVFDNELDAYEELGESFCEKPGSGRVLVIENEISIDTNETLSLAFGLSHHSSDAATASLSIKNPDEALRQRWNARFSALPTVDFENASEEEKKLYYKSWWVIFLNYCNFPGWGFNVLESLPVYKGIWQWAIPAVEWYSSQDTEHSCEWLRSAMNILLNAQNANGYITHAANLHEKTPGAHWLESNTIQNPQLPGTALRYYNVTGDIESLKAWYPKFKKYYNFLCENFDECHRNLHLWALHSSYDTGLDTFPAFQEVTYGINGNPPTEYCYGAILSAERFHYERSMAELSEIMGLNEYDFWMNEARLTKDAINNILWDDSKKWYGALQADGSLDTRIGIDGLFPLVYGIADEKKLSELEPQFLRLIGEYGIRTTARGEVGFFSDIYWRGPCWAKACSLAIVIAKKYFPHLLCDVISSVLRFGLEYPNIWECIDVDSGKLARSNIGFYCTPCMSSNVGAGELIGALWAYHGIDIFGTDIQLPLIPMMRYHYRGLRITVKKSENVYEIYADAAECEENDVSFVKSSGELITIHLKAGKSFSIS